MPLTIRNRSYTFATRSASAGLPHRYPIGVALAGVTLLALAVRGFRLGWQPLWWDEGYSIYFATEPIPRMLWLTARDIHPPLYYGLLHGWFGIFVSSRPEVARLLSVISGVAAIPALAWLALLMRPDRPRLALWAALLLAISPMHLFYSQEVRMYGLALFFILLASAAFWYWVRTPARGSPSWLAAAAYVVAACFALWTLYYSGFVIAAHLLWSAVYFRHTRKAWLWLGGIALAIVILQAPWWAYALPRLLPYIADKVVADKDTPLLPWDYLIRHLLAFSGGHLNPPQPALAFLRLFGLTGLVALAFVWLPKPSDRLQQAQTQPSTHDAATALTAFTLLPILFGYLVNLRFPFFPDGGERLLLTVLPFFLLWLAWGMDRGLHRTWAAALPALPLLLAAASGIATFYTLPRFTEHDYRPIVRFVTQHGRDQDTVVALFPWQVGYWRAYGVRLDSGTWLPPQPSALTQDVLIWNAEIAATLDSALQQGTVWFPAPLSFGSTLPAEIEAHLAEVAINAENRWFSTATRLSAWVQMPATQPQSLGPLTLNPITVESVAVGPITTEAANTPVAITLTWANLPPGDAHVALRLIDATGHPWAHRDYEPLGAFARTRSTGAGQETVAMLVPAGLPPQPYTLALGVGPRGSEQLFTTPAGDELVSLAILDVTAPTTPLHSARLPAARDLVPPWESDGLRLVGFTAPAPGSTWPAGTALPLDLFFQNSNSAPPPKQLWLGLRDRNRETATSWTGWPLPGFPTDSWRTGALVQLPASLDLPATLAPGDYQLVTGLVPDTKGIPTSPARLTTITVTRRPISTTRAVPAVPLDPPAQLGTNARLYGYSVTSLPDRLVVDLDWEILQTLLPAHDIFVHLAAPDGAVLAQADGPPFTQTGPAPTGSWLPGEFLRTRHTLPLSRPLGQETGPLVLHAGLYVPATHVRLPVTIGGVPSGDHVILPIPATD